jgi:signal peptidase II
MSEKLKSYIKLGLVFLFVVFVDQFSKTLIQKYVPYNSSIEIIKGFYYVTFVENTGGAWGILQNKSLFFIIVVAIAIVFITFFIIRTPIENFWIRYSLTLILGGAVGNFLDRIFRSGRVVDFMDFYFGSYHFPTFNLADSMICIGAAMLVVDMFRKERK